MIITPSFRDGAKRRARNPYSAALRAMDSGFAAARRPGMTNLFVPLPNGERERA